jgi:AraC-like DNA-binding protein
VQKPDYCGGLPVTRLRKIEDYVRAHLTEDVSVETLAELAELSRFQFCRVFEALFSQESDDDRTAEALIACVISGVAVQSGRLSLAIVNKSPQKT